MARCVGRLSEVQKNDNASFLPAKAESTEVMNEVARFSDTESLPYLIVVEGSGKVSADQQAAAQRFVAALPGLTLDLPGEPTLSGLPHRDARRSPSRARTARPCCSSCP